MSGVVVDPTGVKVRVHFSDSRPSRSRDIRLPHFVTNYDNDDAAFSLKIVMRGIFENHLWAFDSSNF